MRLPTEVGTEFSWGSDFVCSGKQARLTCTRLVSRTKAFLADSRAQAGALRFQTGTSKDFAGLKPASPLIHGHSGNDHRAVNDVLPESVDTKQIQTVADCRFQQGADQGGNHVAFPSE